MNITEILSIVWCLIAIGFIIVLFLSIKSIVRSMQTKYEIKNKELELDKTKLYCTVNTELVKQSLLLLIRDYTARYMTKSVMVNHISFIKNDQIDEMVHSIVKDTIIEMSDLHLTYCKLLYNINNQEDLTKVIYYLTVDIVLDAVTNFNSSDTSAKNQ